MLKILKNFNQKDRYLLALSLIFIVIQVWLDLKIPDFMGDITYLIQSPTSEMNDILLVGSWMLLCALASFSTSVFVAGIAARIAANFSFDVRSKLFNKIQSFSLEEINSFSKPSLITRSTNDVIQIQMLIVIGLQLLIKAPILAVWALMKIMDKDWHWSLTTGLAIGLLILIVGICIVLVLPKFQKLQRLMDNLNRVTRENLTGLRVVRAYNAEPYQESKFNNANDEFTSTNLFANNVLATLMPTITLIMSGLSLAIYWIGAFIIQYADSGVKMTLFSDMIVFSSYAIQVVMAFMMLIMIFIMIPRAQVSANRINEVLETVPQLKDGSQTKWPSERSGEIEFKNVSFTYPDAEERVLQDISFTAKKGETIAIIGSIGSGKSTLVNLIPRFYDVTSGEVLMNGINVKEYDLRVLRNNLGYVSQNAVLFGGTITSNIAFGSNGKGDILVSDVVDSVYTAQAADFVESMNNNYEADISQGGTNLSGGQKQRISIARAIARRPEVLIFDDSFSALDYKTDRNLRNALKKDSKEMTKIIVAQRISTIKEADQIIVLDAGRMAGLGTHDDLLKTCDVYQEIAYSQLSKEEIT
ncbi:ABC transporter ATP-binding protein [Paenibacillus sp. 7523-1]|uniref:ABC transporter ATP-binding protein n=1 Tax=Paenibacillus sp. 7523-1 TaxID=2022550 RepID=UPI000BA4FB19|nr:ABC transporter ATP-binding protein [Paenibacillus sp. 7523-1]PAD28699.1 multidrug ABC transporter ATP-binding protein [Paenibacillus sp. 7523-1]